MSDGWFPSLPEAIEGKKEPMPTRSEMEEKAKQLGIQYIAKMTDKTLLSRITDELDKAPTG